MTPSITRAGTALDLRGLAPHELINDHDPQPLCCGVCSG
jgi:hypothetical protein